jgi:hypothetical protein
MNQVIYDSVQAKGITRLCHFTPSRNLAHIATQPQGLLATKRLRHDENAVLNPTDFERLDGHEDYVCCSIQYPNAWYLQKAQGREHLFKEWVVLLIAPHYLWLPGTKFCPRNAAARQGRNVREGSEAFEALFAQEVEGAYGKTFRRSGSHPAWLPTDDQAEVLVPDQIQCEDILGIIVRDESQARREAVRLEQLNAMIPPLFISPQLFAARDLSRALRTRNLPEELEYHLGGDDHA